MHNSLVRAPLFRSGGTNSMLYYSRTRTCGKLPRRQGRTYRYGRLNNVQAQIYSTLQTTSLILVMKFVFEPSHESRNLSKIRLSKIIIKLPSRVPLYPLVPDLTHREACETVERLSRVEMHLLTPAREFSK
jgi:hypothetical protein